MCLLWPTLGIADPCPSCRGTRIAVCRDCGGTGISAWTTIHGQRAAYGCERCGGVRGDPLQGTGRPGSGRISCPTCQGTGEVRGAAISSPTPAPIAPVPPAVRRDEPPALVERQAREQAEIQRQHEAFEAAKAGALARLKGLTADTPGIKSLADASVVATTPAGSRGGSTLVVADATVVDLRGVADPERPLVVDPVAVSGAPHADPLTLANANYQAGFAALLRSDPAAAARCFELALRDRPGAALVRHALLLAQDLVRVRQLVQPAERSAAARRLALEAVGELREGTLDGTGAAITRLRAAHELDPADLGIRDTLNFVEGFHHARATAAGSDGALPAPHPEAFRLVGVAIEAVSRLDYDTAVRSMKQAHDLSLRDPDIQNTLSFIEGLAAERARAAQAQPRHGGTLP